MEIDAIVIVPPRVRDVVITGLTLAERARRVVERAGVPRDRIHLIRHADDLAVVGLRPGSGLLVVRAERQLVAPELLAPLAIDAPGPRIAVDDDGDYAGAVRVGDGNAAVLLRALRADLASGERTAASALGAVRVVVGPRARHPAGTPLERQAAEVWQWALGGKPLDGALTRRFWRPLGRPVTRAFLRLPMSPNLITLLGIAMTIAGAAIAAGAGWRVHAIGAALLFAAAVLDGVDGEVARLRLETSRLGGWLDTIGDDISRLAVIVGIGLHVATRHPSLHVGWLIVMTLVLTVVANALLYAWCLARGTADNQGYGPAMGTSWLARFAAFVARRDFSDLFVVGLALADRSEVTLGALAVGSAVTLVVVAVRGTR